MLDKGFTLLNYHMTYVELVATIFGLWATVLSARRITYTWLVNLVAVVLFAVIFYRLKLYSDLILQVYYFIIGILSWLWWNKKAVNHHVPVGYWHPGTGIYILTLLILGIASAIMGFLTSNFHHWMPVWFPHPAALPYPNAVILIVSVFATYLMGRRKIENWWLWAVTNPFAAWIYWQQGSVLMCIVFGVFWLVGLWGWRNWQREYKRQGKN